MTTFQLATLLMPVAVGVVGILYLWWASAAFDRKYGRDPK